MIQTVNINVAALPALRGPGSFMVLSQNENGRQIRFRILGSDLPTGCIATFSGTKPDGNVYSTTGTVSGNFVIVQEDIQMTAVAGIWDAKLEIAKNTENIVTSIIRVTVVRDPVAGDAIPSDSQLDGIVTEVKYYAEHARSEAYGSPLTASTKSAMTDKTRVYVYTGSESGMTAGNWYYWNGSAWTSGGVYNSVAVQSDSELNDFSTNPVQNKVIKAALDQIEGAIPEIDATLSVSGKAADAKKTGDEISGLKEDLSQLEPGLSDEAKQALLACFDKVAWLDGEAPDALAELEAALYADDYPRLSVTFNPNEITIYDDFTEQNIRDLMTVKYYRAVGDYDVITNYSLTYSLTTATTQIIVSYSGLLQTVTTNVVIGRPLTASDIESHIGYVDFSIDADGNISCSNAANFSAIVLNSSITHIRFTPYYAGIDTRKDVAAWMVYHKESSAVVYGNSVTHSFDFTSNGSNYGAQQDDSKTTVTIENNDQFIANTRKDVVLSNGVLTLCEAFTPSARYMITNANVIGVWTDAAQDSSPKNVRVYSD